MKMSIATLIALVANHLYKMLHCIEHTTQLVSSQYQSSMSSCGCTPVALPERIISSYVYVYDITHNEHTHTVMHMCKPPVGMLVLL
jgi:hypothetical protein